MKYFQYNIFNQTEKIQKLQTKIRKQCTKFYFCHAHIPSCVPFNRFLCKRRWVWFWGRCLKHCISRQEMFLFKHMMKSKPVCSHEPLISKPLIYPQWKVFALVFTMRRESWEKECIHVLNNQMLILRYMHIWRCIHPNIYLDILKHFISIHIQIQMCMFFRIT